MVIVDSSIPALSRREFAWWKPLCVVEKVDPDGDRNPRTNQGRGEEKKPSKENKKSHCLENTHQDGKKNPFFFVFLGSGKKRWVYVLVNKRWDVVTFPKFFQNVINGALGKSKLVVRLEITCFVRSLVVVLFLCVCRCEVLSFFLAVRALMRSHFAFKDSLSRWMHLLICSSSDARSQ